MNNKQAYIEGFLKRAAQYGLNETQSIELVKQANILGEPAYKGISDSIKDPKLEEGEGVRAHLKRNANTYLGGGIYGLSGAGLGGLLSLGAAAAARQHNPKIPVEALRKNILGGTALGAAGGSLVGMLLGNEIDTKRKKEIEREALKQELIKTRGGSEKGYEPDPYEGIAPLAAGGGLAALGTGLAVHKLDLLGKLKNYIKSKKPMSAAEQYGKAMVAKRVGPKLLR